MRLIRKTLTVLFFVLLFAVGLLWASSYWVQTSLRTGPGNSALVVSNSGRVHLVLGPSSGMPSGKQFDVATYGESGRASHDTWSYSAMGDTADKTTRKWWLLGAVYQVSAQQTQIVIPFSFFAIMAALPILVMAVFRRRPSLEARRAVIVAA